MKSASYNLFDTPIGLCGIAWRENGAITRLQLPEATPKATEQHIARSSRGRKADAPPPAIAALIGRIRAHLSGSIQDFQDVPLDLAGVRDFDRQVYGAARRIPPGETRTYGDLAKLVSSSVQPPLSNLKLPLPRAVGQAMARNPIPLLIPCHRVLPASGRLGGFSAHGERATKARLLRIERATFPALLAFPS
jgi:methylated-DNA-[protein]-cysteine S-methyltransferase